MKVIIIGGVAGGASTAARLRRLDEQVEIIMLERGQDISFANCGLPYHIGQVIKDRDQLTLINVEKFRQLFNVDVRIKSEVIKINRSQKNVLIRDHINGNEYLETYDQLVLSPGAYPIRPPIPGINDSRIFTLRNLEDMDKIIAYIRDNKVQKAAVVGGGFIGLEMAENLAGLGLKVSVIELANQVMTNFDYDMSTFIHQHLKSKNIELFLNNGVSAFHADASSITIQLQNKATVQADMVIFSAGVKPEIKLAQEAGLAIGPSQGIQVNSLLQTSDPAIYAIGDAAEVINLVSGQPSFIPLANAANKQGRVVAENILGHALEYQGTTAAAIAKVFDLTVASVGLNEAKLKAAQIPYQAVYLLPTSHAGYYPDAYPLFFKLLYQPNSQEILGGQIIGVAGVDKRIDVLAAMLQHHKTVVDLARLELAYAPPYSSAKDALNLAGMIALNQIQGLNPVIAIPDAEAAIQQGAFLLDVRAVIQYQLSHIAGAKNIPLEELRQRISELPTDRPIIVYCVQGKTAYFAVRILLNHGFKQVFNLNGGYKLYQSLQQTQENKGIFVAEFVQSNDEIQDMPSANLAADYHVVMVDACGLQCPGPILKLANAIEKAGVGDMIELTTTDVGFKNDIAVWCERTQNQLLQLTEEKGKIVAKIQKGLPKIIPQMQQLPNDKTLVVFSNDLDKAIAAFIIATGAASMNRKVTMFFTFWGLNILRKSTSVAVKKNILEKMFGFMMPQGSKKLALSKMEMFGIGTKLIRYIMKTKNIDSLEDLIKVALNQNIRLVACQMSMEVMGIKKEELIDGVEIGGVASYLGAAELADTNLFI